MSQDALRAALETLDGLATAVIAMKLAIPIGRPLGPEWQAFLARTGDVNRWLDENDRVQGRAALASRDTGVVEGAGLDLRIEQERRSAFLAAQEAVRLLSPRSKAIGTIGHMVARADAAIARLGRVECAVCGISVLPENWRNQEGSF